MASVPAIWLLVGALAMAVNYVIISTRDDSEKLGDIRLDAFMDRLGDSTEENCPLTESAQWCQVHSTAYYPSFEMAVYPEHDIVGSAICSQGGWESIPFDVIEAATPDSAKKMLDIGANAGWYSLLFAMRGWQVEAFEPMPLNSLLLEATMCRYPNLKKFINLHKVALGSKDKNHVCGAYSATSNIGDATICCPGEPCGGTNHVDTNPRFVHRGDFHVHSLDGMLEKDLSLTSGSVGYVKIDVEGYECDLVMGAKKMLQDTRPLLIQSEVNTYHSNACPPKEYLHKYADSGYKVHTQSFTGAHFDFDGHEIKQNTADNYFMRLHDDTEVSHVLGAPNEMRSSTQVTASRGSP